MAEMEEKEIEIPIYELRTIGNSVNGWRLDGLSKFVFLDRQAAAEHIERFETMWYDKTQFEHAEKDTLKTTIRERTLKISRHTLETLLRDCFESERTY